MSAQSTWKKSTASMLVAWVCRNCRQLLSVCRTGAGGMRWRWRIRRIVEALTRWPSVSSSPWSRWYPHRGFSRAMRTTYHGGEGVVDRWSSGPVGVGTSSADEAAVPAQDRVRGDQAMGSQCSGQSLDEGGEDGPVRPVQGWSLVGAAEHGDLVAQHEEFDVLGGGRAAHQQDQPEHLPEDQVQQTRRHAGIMSDQRSPLVSDPVPSSGTPQEPHRSRPMMSGRPPTAATSAKPPRPCSPPRPSSQR